MESNKENHDPQVTKTAPYNIRATIREPPNKEYTLVGDSSVIKRIGPPPGLSVPTPLKMNLSSPLVDHTSDHDGGFAFQERKFTLAESQEEDQPPLRKITKSPAICTSEDNYSDFLIEKEEDLDYLVNDAGLRLAQFKTSTEADLLSPLKDDLSPFSQNEVARSILYRGVYQTAQIEKRRLLYRYSRELSILAYQRECYSHRLRMEEFLGRGHYQDMPPRFPSRVNFVNKKSRWAKVITL